jgi:hypothetical protein
MFGMSWFDVVLEYAPMALIAVGAFYLGFRAIRSLERRRESASNEELMLQRISALEDAQLRAAEEIQHLRAQHDFTTRLLEQRRSPTDAV